MINTETGSEADVLGEIEKIKEVDEAVIVYGTYDIIARVRAETMEKVKEIITPRMRNIPKLRSTLTMLVIEGQDISKE